MAASKPTCSARCTAASSSDGGLCSCEAWKPMTVTRAPLDRVETRPTSGGRQGRCEPSARRLGRAVVSTPEVPLASPQPEGGAMSLVRPMLGVRTPGAVVLGTSGAPSNDVHAAASPAPAAAAESAETGPWALPIFDTADPVAIATDDATTERADPVPDAQGAASSGGGGLPNPPGMVNGTFPGLVWAVADVREVRSAVNAFRSSKGLPALGAPSGSCADRGVIATPAFGIPAGTTHGKLLVKQNAAFLSAVPKDGGIMTADIAAAGDTDITGTFRPNSTVLLRLY